MNHYLNHSKAISMFFLFSFMVLLPFSNMTITTSSYQSQDSSTLIYEYSFNQPQLKRTTNDSWTVEIENLKNSNTVEKPMLPVQPLRLLLPYATTIEQITVRKENTDLLKKDIQVKTGTNLIPIKQKQQFNDKNQLIPTKNSLENTDILTSSYENIGVFTLHGCPVILINLYPVQYQASTGKIFFSEKLSVELTLTQNEHDNVLRLTPDDKKTIRTRIDNPSVLTSYPTQSTNEQYEYVIITGEKFIEVNEAHTFADFVEYKKEKGINTTIVTVEEITSNPDYTVDGIWGDNNPDNPFYQTPIIGDKTVFDDTQARIRNFIRYAYTTWGTKYVLLAGDSDTNNPDELIVPHRGLFADEHGLPLHGTLAYETDDLPSDVYYACLDGNFNYDGDNHFGEAPKFNDEDDTIDEADLFAEVNVGRACIDSSEEVSNFVQKTIQYDNLFYDDYFKHILFLGEHLGSQFYFPYGGSYKDLIEPILPDNYELTKLYQRDDTFDMETYWHLLNEDPPLIINHDGHGSPTSAMKLSCSVIEQISNDRYYFIYSHTCLAGSFDNHWPPDTYYETDCVAEYFTVETPHGAIGVIMNSRYGLGSENTAESPSGAYDESFFKAVFEENIRKIGPANHYSKEAHVNRINENGMRWAFYETNLFGDPEIAIKDPNPTVDVDVSITQPTQKALYINENPPIQLSFLQHPCIIGEITIEVDATTQPENNLAQVTFLIDNQTVFVDEEPPYTYNWNPTKKGIQTIQVIAESTYNDTQQDTQSVFVIW